MTDSTRTVVITGASSGFGEGAVRAFADRGYRVWGTMRASNGRNAGKKAALEAISPAVTVIEMDVASDASVAEGFATILAEGPVDILINNAGIMYIGLTEAFSTAQAQEQINSNYLGAIRAMQAVLPSMRAAGSGLIINTSSVAGRISTPFMGTYCASKHALEAYSQSLRYEVAAFGVDVALVEPGPFPSTNLLAAGARPARAEVLATYGDLAAVPTAMFRGFADMAASGAAPDPQMVIRAYLALADAAPGKRPTRTVVSINWGVGEINAFTQPRQDALLKAMQRDTVLGGADL